MHGVNFLMFPPIFGLDFLAENTAGKALKEPEKILILATNVDAMI